jgi:hypothetical protein
MRSLQSALNREVDGLDVEFALQMLADDKESASRNTLSLLA